MGKACVHHKLTLGLCLIHPAPPTDQQAALTFHRSRRFIVAMSKLTKLCMILILALLSYTSNGSELKSEEDLLRAICQGNATERSSAIKILADAYTSTNATPQQKKIGKERNEFFAKAISQPYDDKNQSAKVWFSAVDVLIDKLKTDEKEQAGVILGNICINDWPPKYEIWAQKWPGQKAGFINYMNSHKPK